MSHWNQHFFEITYTLQPLHFRTLEPKRFITDLFAEPFWLTDQPTNHQPNCQPSKSVRAHLLLFRSDRSSIPSLIVLFVHVHFVSEVPLFLLYVLFVFRSVVFMVLLVVTMMVAVYYWLWWWWCLCHQSHTTNTTTSNTFLSINIISIDAKPLFKHFH